MNDHKTSYRGLEERKCKRVCGQVVDIPNSLSTNPQKNILVIVCLIKIAIVKCSFYFLGTFLFAIVIKMYFENEKKAKGYFLGMASWKSSITSFSFQNSKQPEPQVLLWRQWHSSTSDHPDLVNTQCTLTECVTMCWVL